MCVCMRMCRVGRCVRVSVAVGGGVQMRKVLPGDLCLFPGWDMNLG